MIPNRKYRHPAGQTGRLAPVPTGRTAALHNGHNDGYPLGWRHGHHFGRCQAIINRFSETSPSQLPCKVLYVTSGKGVPYSPIDEAVVDALRLLAAEYQVASPTANVAELAKLMKPDLVLVLEGLRFPPDQANALRYMGVKTAVWFTDDPYYTDLTAPIAPYYDYVFTLEMNCVPFYEGLGCQNVYYLPLGVDTNRFRPQRIDTSHRRDVTFIGSAYWNRVSFIDSLATVLANKHTLISGWWWDRLKNFAKLSPKINNGAWMSPQDTAKYYYGAQIVLNLHREHDDDSYNYNSRNIKALSVNPRTFEIAACGTFQLTDERSDLRNLYIPDEEIVVYSTPEEFIQKMDYYLTHEDERNEISWRALQRTLADHTYVKRLKTMFNILQI